MIRSVTPSDSAKLCQIYNHYVIHSFATFEEIPITDDEMATRIQKVLAEGLPWLVEIENEAIMGYAKAAKWRERPAYRYSVETSIYVSRNFTQQGFGSVLYQRLIDQIKKLDLHAVMAGIALPNPASLALHEKLGFKKVAHFKEVGLKFGRWIDVGYWELILTDE